MGVLPEGKPQVRATHPTKRFCEHAALRYPEQFGPEKTDQRDLAGDATATSPANGNNTLPVADAGEIRHQREPVPQMQSGPTGADRKGVSR